MPSEFPRFESKLPMMLVLILFTLFVIIIPGLFWFIVVEGVLCRNCVFPYAEKSEGLKKIFLVKPFGVGGLSGFEVFENGTIKLEFNDGWAGAIEKGRIRYFDYMETRFGFKATYRFSQVEFYEADTLLGTYQQNVGVFQRSSLNLVKPSISLRHPEKWNADLDIYNANSKIATITFDHAINILRHRKLCFFENVDVRMEALLCMIAAFTVPKFGRMGRQ